MNHHIKKIQLKMPCNQDWNSMNDVLEGKFCMSCNKNVIDFSMLTNQEILTYLSGKDKICGRFEKQQIININNQLYQENRTDYGKIKGWLIAIALLGSTASFKAAAQSVAVLTEKSFDLNKISPTNLVPDKNQWLNDSTALKQITGTVTDGENECIYGATIRLLTDKNIGTMADENGNFKLMIPGPVTQFEVLYVGYNPQIININQTQTNYNIKLSEEVMGDIEVIRPPFFKRIYYRFIKRPIRKIFH